MLFYVGINIEWNIFAGGTNYAELKEAAYDYQSSEFSAIQTGRVAQNDAMYSFRFVEFKSSRLLNLESQLLQQKLHMKNISRNMIKVQRQLLSTSYY